MIVNGSALALAGMNPNAVEVNSIADKKNPRSHDVAPLMGESSVQRYPPYLVAMRPGRRIREPRCCLGCNVDA